MAVIRWEPVGELNTIQNEMNRLFNTFFDQPAATGRSGANSRRWVPAMDLVETADHYVLGLRREEEGFELNRIYGERLKAPREGE